ncbi:MAG: hypothetical protein A2Y79_07840 [Deltaproteobacteria bacterium RBG_13_43_22]|nr:MAG: hypothetical protein A2Y79_07840 [Deltaproteobacteria bacterium RBG_13_43_22]
MSLKNKISENKSLPLSYIIKVTVGLIILLGLLSIRYIFPNNPFIIKYFTGFYGLLWFAFFWVIVFILDFIISKRNKK